MKVREGSVKDSVKGVYEVPILVPLVDPSSAVHKFANQVGIHAKWRRPGELNRGTKSELNWAPV